MAGSSLLALIDDIASILDDVALLTKVAAKKTTGVLGDDLALNAEQVSGIAAERELPVVYAVAKGSALNKIILVPAALLISQIMPVLIVPLLIVGGSFLCYEGFEKIYNKLFHPTPPLPEKIDDLTEAILLDLEKIHDLEKVRIKGAIRTDLILSAEIVVITLGTVANETLVKQALVLSGISFLMTVGVYGLVAVIVKLDDMGLHLLKSNNPKFYKEIGKALLLFAPALMKFLGLAGTVAMFMVGGGIISHNISPIHHLLEPLNLVLTSFLEIALGLLIGALALALHHLFIFTKSKFNF